MPIFGTTGPVFVSRTSSVSSSKRQRPHLTPKSPIAQEPESPMEEFLSIAILDTLYTPQARFCRIAALIFDIDNQVGCVRGRRWIGGHCSRC